MEITQIATALAIVLALIGVLRLGLGFAGLDSALAEGRALRVRESVALGGRRRILLVEAEGERLLLASSEQGLSLLRVLSGEASDAKAANEGDTLEASTQTALNPRSGGASPAGRTGRWLSLLPALATCALLAMAGDASAAELAAEGLNVSFEGGEGLSSSIELLALVTFISVAPSLLLMATCFTRVVIVLAFVRQAIGVAQLPPNQVLVGLALFLTLFVMAPLGETIKSEAYDPYVAGELGADDALERGLVPVRRYLMSYTREADLALFSEMSQMSAAGQAAAATDEEPSLRVLLPAFLISELRTAFEIGFTIFLPFLVIDLVIASMLISMGMIVLPPIVVSLPFKIMLFVLIDGWNLVLGALVEGLR